jgi:hypothetical protein
VGSILLEEARFSYWSRDIERMSKPGRYFEVVSRKFVVVQWHRAALCMALAEAGPALV